LRRPASRLARWHAAQVTKRLLTASYQEPLFAYWSLAATRSADASAASA
jgi:hypothetical protein